MRLPRIVVAFELVESREQRVFRQAATGVWDGVRPAGRGVYWCAADRPESVPVRALGLRADLPVDARCAECGIEISELQVTMRELRARHRTA